MRYPYTEAAIQRAILCDPDVQDDAAAYRYHRWRLIEAERAAKQGVT